MRKIKNIFLFSLVVVLLLQGACQKEDYSNNNIVLVYDGQKQTSTTNYELSGTILSTGKLNLEQYGFEVDVNSTYVPVYQGALDKPGKVKIDFPVSGGTTLGEVIMVAIDKNGKYYTSKPGYVPIIAGPPAVAFISPLFVTVTGHSTDGNYEYFNGSVSNADPLNYTVKEYGVEYRINGSSSGFIKYPFSTTDNATSIITIDNGIQTGTIFTKTADYEFRYYAIVSRNSDLKTVTSVSYSSAFTAS